MHKYISQKQGAILDAILDERERQETLIHAGKFKYSCDSPQLTHLRKLSVLAEEFGEAAKEVNDMAEYGEEYQRRMKLRAELIQTAAVCIAWLESADMQPEWY